MPAVLTAQAKLSEVLTDTKVPAGGVAAPYELSPQHARVPSVLIAQGAPKPMLTDVKVPAGGATPDGATYTYNAFPGGINCATASAADVERAILENFERGRPFTYQVQVPVAGKTLQDGTAGWTLTTTGAFVRSAAKAASVPPPVLTVATLRVLPSSR